MSICRVNTDTYFMCNMDDFKFLADMVEHVNLPLRSRYIFCCAPIAKQRPYICTMFLKVCFETEGWKLRVDRVEVESREGGSGG